MLGKQPEDIKMTKKEIYEKIAVKVAKEYEGKEFNLFGRNHDERKTFSNSHHSRAAVDAGFPYEIISGGKYKSRYFSSEMVTAFIAREIETR